jgi:hypothetical protein
MTNEEKLTKTREELSRYESDNPRSREDVHEAAASWLETAQHVNDFDVQAALGTGILHGEHLAAVIGAYTVASPAFREWVLAQVDGEGLPSRKERDKRLSALRKAVKDAEVAVKKAELDARKSELENELAALGA